MLFSEIYWIQVGNNLKQIFIIIFQVLILLSCRQGQESREEKTESIPSPIINFEGDFVSDGYDQRNEGYDWVSVSIHVQSDSVAEIQVRSRSDKKKPTCSYEGRGILIDAQTLKAVLQDEKHMLLSVDGDQLTIQPETSDDKNMLYYYCSGGATLAGTYEKISGPLDESQFVDPPFERTLTLQGITFYIHATTTGSINTLTIEPAGLEEDNRPAEHEIEGTVTNAEIEDLNSDGSPEILVYIQSAGSGSYGSVIGYSVNNKKSMSQIYLPDIMDNPEARIGYMGHDEFTIVETTFVRRFPIYKEGDTNSNPTGGTRQIQYKLVDGEAGRIFKIDKIIEY
jgi:hypothetical protein